MDYLFRNRLFGAVVALLILAFIAGTASRSLTSAPAPAPIASEDPHAAFARWAAQDPDPAADQPEPDARKHYEVRVYQDGRDVTSQVSDLPENATPQTAPVDSPPQ